MSLFQPPPGPHVVARRLGTSTVLVNLKTNEILELNETGSRVWELLSEMASVPQVSAQLVEEFEVDPGEAERAVVRFLQLTASQGVLQLEQ